MKRCHASSKGKQETQFHAQWSAEKRTIGQAKGGRYPYRFKKGAFAEMSLSKKLTKCHHTAGKGPTNGPKN